MELRRDLGFTRRIRVCAGCGATRRIVRPHDEAAAKRTPRPVTASIPRQEDLSRLLPSLGARARLRTTREHFGSSGLQHRHEQQHHFGLPASRCALARSASALDKQRQSGGLGRVGMRCASGSRQHKSKAHTSGITDQQPQASGEVFGTKVKAGDRMRTLRDSSASSSRTCGPAPSLSHDRL
ncbi:hypothetical protein A4X06_0g9512 [Tilletia controversa]|uniref:Uncharacterized protein n=1 Tax=Tilletia controversa TaxID=13291 RepID=A0A8X7MIQ4_9BASI|nr:hypothetical protein A4X06_0g9512 [Tilletia controversa]